MSTNGIFTECLARVTGPGILPGTANVWLETGAPALVPDNGFFVGEIVWASYYATTDGGSWSVMRLSTLLIAGVSHACPERFGLSLCGVEVTDNSEWGCPTEPVTCPACRERTATV